MPKRDEPRHLCGALGGFSRSARHTLSLVAHFLTLSQLMEAENRGENEQRGHQMEAARHLDLPHVIEEVRDRGRKNYEQRNCQPHHEDDIIAPHQSHGGLTMAAASTHICVGGCAYTLSCFSGYRRQPAHASCPPAASKWATILLRR